MCGIFVVFSKKGNPLPSDRCIDASRELYNRGPDYFKYNFFRKNTLYLSNTILSITGVPEKENKISSSLNRNFFISFNGEIYNYRGLCKNFLPKFYLDKHLTDTKVLINLHEKINYKSIPDFLNGMYAYTIFDKKEDKLIIANDVQGEKSLYYSEDENFFIISSTINAILKFKKSFELNTDPLKNYLLTRHFMSNKDTCYKGISVFKNGSINSYSLSKKKIFYSSYDNPFNWISEKKYNEYSKMDENEIIELLDLKLTEQAKIMIPKIDFGCIVSGGIDSTLQSAIISKIKQPKNNLVINHVGKDKIMDHINKFNDYFKNKIKKIKLDKHEYSKLAKNCYKIVSSPMHTHDLPGRLLISKQFRKLKCKVFFSADGCDELLGGQQIYHKIFNKSFDYKVNQSPYSSLNKISGIKPSENIQNFLNKNWKLGFNKYGFIKFKKERNIQNSLFLDYFIQSIAVGNRSNDLISCNSSVEPRNIYISKNILKFLVNLPLKYKINFREKNVNLRQKFILKKLFIKYFSKKLIFGKEGFSGFPNDTIKKIDYEVINKSLKLKKEILNFNNYDFKDNKNFKRDIEWKLKNIQNFLKLT